MRPSELIKMLTSLGWHQPSHGLTGLYIFEHPDHPGRQMVFPSNVAAPDYRESVDSVLQKITYLHNPKNAFTSD